MHKMQNCKETHRAQKDDQDGLHNESCYEFTMHLTSADQQSFFKKTRDTEDGPIPLLKM